MWQSVCGALTGPTRPKPVRIGFVQPPVLPWKRYRSFRSSIQAPSTDNEITRRPDVAKQAPRNEDRHEVRKAKLEET
ncbi:hypothetical protein SAMD00023353_0503010 [Rosellinia necatrix]|uniref:Uncharacterized protein n=1 Tax=Rosellinia necatrix TaxID=77044 RepID=A0A1S8A5S5_ROSNE|nr:hypothetical protein SAMD00023353_0503010 [Rosellinia necatrix]